MDAIQRAEINVVGAVFVEPRLINNVIERVDLDAFSAQNSEILKAVFKIVSGQSKRFKKVSVMTVWELLKNKKTNVTREYIGNIAGHITSAADFEDSIVVVADNNIRTIMRENLEDVKTLINENEDLDDVIAAVDMLRRKANKNIDRFVQPPTLKDHLEEVRMGITKVITAPERVSGIPSGFPRVDYFTGGFQDEFIIVGGRPSMGKTAFVLDICNASVRHYGYKPAVFTYEMTTKQLLLRLICGEAEVSYPRIKKGQLNTDDQIRLNKTIELYKNYDLIIDETMYDLDVLASKIETTHDIHKIDYAVIDYIGLIPVPKKRFNARSREEEVSRISSTLKGLTKRLGIPIIAVSQLSRLSARKKGMPPTLDELRESGSLEQDADVVIFIHRPYYYRIKERKGKNMKNVAEIYIAKQRNGPVGMAEVIWDHEHAKFVNPAIRWINVKRN